MSKMIILAAILVAAMAGAAHADNDYSTKVFHDGTVVAYGPLVDLYTGVLHTTQALGDVTDKTMGKELVEVDG
jgi:hypothetical protein